MSTPKFDQAMLIGMRLATLERAVGSVLIQLNDVRVNLAAINNQIATLVSYQMAHVPTYYQQPPPPPNVQDSLLDGGPVA